VGFKISRDSIFLLPPAFPQNPLLSSQQKTIVREIDTGQDGIASKNEADCCEKQRPFGQKTM
jgi:hypothetical protein